MAVNDGGPAFPTEGRLCYDDRGQPRQHDGRHIIMRGGLSKRDWYEANALASVWWWLPAKLKVRVARATADAMLAARSTEA